MAQRNDQIFQLSLTEIAFCIVFILLLLLGYLVIKEQEERKRAEETLAQLHSAEVLKQLLDNARAALATELANAGKASPDDVITKLVEAQKLREERDMLHKRVEDLDAKLTALTELKKLIEQSAGDKSEIAKSEVANALALQAEVRKELSEPKANPSRKMGDPSEATSSLDAVKQAIATTKVLRAELKSKLGLEPNALTEKLRLPLKSGVLGLVENTDKESRDDSCKAGACAVHAGIQTGGGASGTRGSGHCGGGQGVGHTQGQFR